MRRFVLALMLLPTALSAAVQQRPRVALVTPEVVCHVAPSHSANVAEVLKVMGDAWAVEIWVERTATGQRGDRPHHPRRGRGDLHGCTPLLHRDRG